MTPLRCERRGGDQKRVRLWDCTETNVSFGAPLGTEISKSHTFKCMCYGCCSEKQLTILFCNYADSCCRSSSNTGVSCDATGVVGVWQESTQCGCGLWAIHCVIECLSTTSTLEQIVSNYSIGLGWLHPEQFNACWILGCYIEVNRCCIRLCIVIKVYLFIQMQTLKLLFTYYPHQ